MDLQKPLQKAWDLTAQLHLIFLLLGTSVPNGSVTLVTVRGLPDELAFNKGAKLDNGDWLLVEEDIYVDPKATPLVQSDLKLIAVDDDYSGSFFYQVGL